MQVARFSPVSGSGTPYQYIKSYLIGWDVLVICKVCRKCETQDVHDSKKRVVIVRKEGD